MFQIRNMFEVRFLIAAFKMHNTLAGVLEKERLFMTQEQYQFSASEILNRSNRFFALDENLLMVFTPEQLMFLHRLNFWIQGKISAMQSGEKIMGWIEEEKRMYVFKTTRKSSKSSIKSWLQEFPFLSESSFRRLTRDLTQKGILIKANHNAYSNDDTIWYTINYVALNAYYVENIGGFLKQRVLTELGWQLDKWVRFCPKVGNDTLSEVDLRKKNFEKEDRTEALNTAKDIMQDTLLIQVDQIDVYVEKLEQILSEKFLKVSDVQNDRTKSNKSLEGEKFNRATKKNVKPHEQWYGQNEQSRPVKMTAPITKDNQPEISDTKKIPEQEFSENLKQKFEPTEIMSFGVGFNRSFLTKRTVQLLKPYGVNNKKDTLSANNLADIIFHTKANIDRKYAGLREPLNGELWNTSIEFEVQKFTYQMKLRQNLPEGDKKKIKTPLAFFASIMTRFWTQATEAQESMDPLALMEQKKNLSSGESLLEEFIGRFQS